MGSGSQNNQFDETGTFAQQAQSCHTVGGFGRLQRQFENLGAVPNDCIAQNTVAVGGCAEDQRQRFAAQLEPRCRCDTRKARTGMAGQQLAIQVEHVQSAFARGGDDKAQRGGVAVRQKVDGRSPAFHTGEGRGHQNFGDRRFGLGVGAGLFGRIGLTAGGENEKAGA